MKSIYMSILLICFSSFISLNAQTLFYSDTYHGGVTAGGVSTGMGGSQTYTLSLHIPQSSTIRKAFLFVYTNGNPEKKEFRINNKLFSFKINSRIMDVSFQCLCATPVRSYYKEITNFINLSATDTFVVTVPGAVGDSINWGWYCPILYVEYEKPSMPQINTSLWINDKDYFGYNSYSFHNMNPINSSFPVALSIFDDRACSISDGTVIKLNGNDLGTIGGSDSVNYNAVCGGSKGHFYYENNTLYGLNDDTPDDTMHGTDALADISSYLNPNATSYDMILHHAKYPGQDITAPNVHLLFINAYSTPCAPIPATVSPDTTICYGETVQLHASGGTKYEWSSTTTKSTTNPAPGLSCSNCPNPVFSGDSSQVYTVRIWSNDSCSVVRPVRVTVRKPKSTIFSTSPSDCISPTGSINFTKNETIWNRIASWQIITEKGDTITTNQKNISGLGHGTYFLTVTDTMGCTSATDTLKILPNNNTITSFTASPLSGKVPFTVAITNHSVNANQFEWFINGISQGSSLTQLQIDTSGTYIVLLVGSQNGICKDTDKAVIYAKGSAVLSISQFLSPNGDGKNDTWFIENIGNYPNNEVTVFNRWGNVVFQKTGYKNKWDGVANRGATVGDGKLPNGTYFYVVKVEKEGKSKAFKGYLELER